MKKNGFKVFAVVLTLVLNGVLLTGCGSATPSSEPTPPPPATGDYAEEEVSNKVEEEPATSNASDDYVGSDEGIIKDDLIDEPAMSDGLDEITPSAQEVTGIIAVKHYTYGSKDGTGMVHAFDVNSIDPATGALTLIAQFGVFRSYRASQDEYYDTFPLIGYNNLMGYDRRWFSADYSKMAITRIFNEKGETHAGWIDTAGNFFDVTEALGEQSSDFGDPVTYCAAGFFDDGLFLYNDNPYATYGAWANANFRFTDVNTLSPSQDGSALIDICQRKLRYDAIYAFTDHIDDTMSIVTTKDSNYSYRISAKYNKATDEIIEYIPGESRENWSGVCSPDGTQIAFLSMPKQGNGGPEIFVIPFDGGEPQKLECDIVFGQNPEVDQSAILEWK